MMNIKNYVMNNLITLIMFKYTTVIIWCAYSMPITALVILTKYSQNLDKCDVDFRGWMVSFILLMFMLITFTLMERCIDDKRFCAKSAGVIMLTLWIIGVILLANSIKTGICKDVSIYVYNFMLFIFFFPIVEFVVFIIFIIITPNQ